MRVKFKYDKYSENKGWPVQEGTVYPNLEEAAKNVGTGWGYDVTSITKEQAQQLLNGGVLAFDDGEYTHYIILKQKGEDE